MAAGLGSAAAMASTSRTSSGEHPVSALDVGPHLLGLGCPGDDRSHDGLGGQPGDGQLEEGVAVVCGEALQLLDDVHRGVGEQVRRRRPSIPASRVPAGGGSPRRYLPDRRPVASGK